LVSAITIVVGKSPTVIAVPAPATDNFKNFLRFISTVYLLKHSQPYQPFRFNITNQTNATGKSISGIITASATLTCHSMIAFLLAVSGKPFCKAASLTILVIASELIVA
jgi:hypothetical protein